MNKLLLGAFILIMVSCDKPQPVGQQIFLAKENISFILTDSTLIKGKPTLYPPDSAPNGSYGESAAFYCSPDSTTMVSIYVTAMPGNKYHPSLPWRAYANEKQARDVVMARNQGLAVIERYTADSTTHAIEINYHLPKRAEQGRRGQSSYATSLIFRGRYRKIECYFLTPNNAQNRQQLAALRNSLTINPVYLTAVAKRYQDRDYQD